MTTTRLYIGIETKVREFDAKVLLGCVAAEAGYDVVIGQQKVFLKHLDRMPRGILINKSISPRKAAMYRHYNKLGFRLAAYDEEGLAPFSADEYLKRRISVESLKELACFFAWGERQAEIIAQKAPADVMRNVALVGHPRVDLTRRELRGFYDDEVNALRAKYGRFLLINTNFSFYNHFRGRDFEVILQDKAKAGKVVNEAHRAYYWRVNQHKKTLFYAFVEMIKAMRQRFPEMTVIVRPHPSESQEYWREVLPSDDNIQVVHEGNVLPWILAADVMIHNSCTTGIEAYLLERPVLSYRPVQSEEIDGELPNMLSDQEYTLDALLNRLESVLENGQPPTDSQKHATAARYMTGLDGLLSSERIVEQLNKIVIPEPTFEMAAHRLYTKAQRIKGKIAGKIAQWRSPESAEKKASSDASNDRRAQYGVQKFPGIAVEEILSVIAKLQRASMRFSRVQARQIGKDMVQLTAAGE